MQYPYLHFLQQSCKEKGILHVAFFGFLLWFVGVFCCLGLTNATGCCLGFIECKSVNETPSIFNGGGAVGAR